jgi:ketosteroid isomerase-like protein
MVGTYTPKGTQREDVMREPTSSRLTAAAIILIVGLSAVAAAEDQNAEDLTRELRETEMAFARTMADRDHEAFTSYLAEESVFFGPNGEIRGRDAVAAAWKPFYQDERPPFSWQPESATVLDSGNLGLTSGPVLAPDGTRVGTFNSVWRRIADGTWEIVFDRGCPPCDCPPAED